MVKRRERILIKKTKLVILCKLAWTKFIFYFWQCGKITFTFTTSSTVLAQVVPVGGWKPSKAPVFYSPFFNPRRKSLPKTLVQPDLILIPWGSSLPLTIATTGTFCLTCATWLQISLKLLVKLDPARDPCESNLPICSFILAGRGFKKKMREDKQLSLLLLIGIEERSTATGESRRVLSFYFMFGNSFQLSRRTKIRGNPTCLQECLNMLPYMMDQSVYSSIIICDNSKLEPTQIPIKCRMHP